MKRKRTTDLTLLAEEDQTLLETEAEEEDVVETTKETKMMMDSPKLAKSTEEVEAEEETVGKEAKEVNSEVETEVTEKEAEVQEAEEAEEEVVNKTVKTLLKLKEPLSLPKRLPSLPKLRNESLLIVFILTKIYEQ